MNRRRGCDEDDARFRPGLNVATLVQCGFVCTTCIFIAILVCTIYLTVEYDTYYVATLPTNAGDYWLLVVWYAVLIGFMVFSACGAVAYSGAAIPGTEWLSGICWAISSCMVLFCLVVSLVWILAPGEYAFANEDVTLAGVIMLAVLFLCSALMACATIWSSDQAQDWNERRQERNFVRRREKNSVIQARYENRMREEAAEAERMRATNASQRTGAGDALLTPTPPQGEENGSRSNQQMGAPPTAAPASYPWQKTRVNEKLQ
jgi:hypothetical protein